MIYDLVNRIGMNAFPARRQNSYNSVDIVESIFVFVLIVVFALIISTYVVNFPDFPGYDRYIKGGFAVERFGREPISALLMYFFGKLGWGAREYYITSIICLYFSVWLIALSLPGYKRVSFFLLIVMSPLTLILLQTPRFSFAMAFGLLALLGPSRLVLPSLLICIFSHTVMGVLALFFIFVRYFDIKYYLLFVFLSVVAFLMIGNGFIFSAYSSYFIDDTRRGVGRVAIFILISIYGVCFSSFSMQHRVFIYLSIVLCVSLYLITPFSHRISTFVTYLILYETVSRQRFHVNKITLWGGNILMGSISLYIVYYGEYNYG